MAAPATKNPPAQTQLVTMEKLGSLIERCQTAVATAKDQIVGAFALAIAVQDLRTAIVPFIPQIRPLIGTSLGFLTDRDKSDKYPPYGDAVIADCLIEATARGLRWIGNEFNIIGGRCYVTKEGFARLVGNFPGLTDLKLSPSVPVLRDGGSVVKYLATWLLNGELMRMERDIPTRLNAGMGADAAIGKATRKMLASIHARISGSTQSFSDGDDEPEQLEAPTTAPALPKPVADRMNGNGTAAPKPTPPAASEDDGVARGDDEGPSDEAMAAEKGVLIDNTTGTAPE